jgi:hypothetical protein
MIYWRNLAEGLHTESFRNCQRHVASCAAVSVVSFQWHLISAKSLLSRRRSNFSFSTSQPLKVRWYLYVPPAVIFDSYLFCSDTFYVLTTTSVMSLNLKKNTDVHLTYIIPLWLTFWRRNYFFLILAHPIYKMRIIQEPNRLELWNKLHF